MLSLYECAQEIKKETGWSQERIGAETGLGLSTISRIFRIPGYRGNEISKVLIGQLHDEVVPSPFPAYLEILLNRYEGFREKLSHKEFSEYLDSTEVLLLNHRAFSDGSLEGSRLRWLLGHIEFDRAFYLRRDQINSTVRALDWYQQALGTLEDHADQKLLIQRYKLQQCMVSAKFNSCKPGTRADDPRIQQWLRDMDYLTIVEAVVKEDSWNWIAARNGLISASILRNREKCLLFWNAMRKVHKQFHNPEFTPSRDQLAVAHDPDLIWFRTHILQG
ncbi:hypothetical protein [Candidatus Venteria ishoeyi]|uniref:HTH cro/C1-type domain-containing protein n=1 Tax=Candidatus Venteria ishoeyi TaxID=1899563 RepID=A0A1H6F617_9GAMM|nr:hypothetical protein [Candidatus Venteria ishoeyi]MDM8547731.1 hypothetical protein [Candidatus Venteria ishoeyi]SEH04831.1 Uncharacterised protein [Candidatus Venteria ishoeyi]